MFDTAELGRAIEKSSYDAQVPELRTALLKVQHALAKADFPVIVLLHGVDLSGRGEVFNLLHAWLDARYLVPHAYERPTQEEREHPEYWRFWNWLPPKGHIGIFLGSWYTRPLLSHAREKCSEKNYIRELERAAEFEKTLADAGTLFIKFWFHITEAEQERRLEAYADSREQRFRVRKRNWKNHALYGQFLRSASRALRETSTAQVPWTIVEANDERYRNVTVARHLTERIGAYLEEPAHSSAAPSAHPHIRDPITILDTLDLGKRLEGSEYDERLKTAQSELNRLAHKLHKRQTGSVFVFEGWDAAGKGGAIRRITQALDARQYRVVAVGPPSEEERAQHYLWRFWRYLPRVGRIAIYDRSWYGRVLVERVEGFASAAEWQRAYKEINDFEEQLFDGNLIVIKFWLHISKDEQLKRFQAREAEPWKQYKLTPEDYRNRARSDEYEIAVNDMLAATDTECAPWTLVEAEDKHFARVKVLETICGRLKELL